MRHILVVDDDLHTRLAIGIWLKQCGFRVAITDGDESGLAENMPQRALPLQARRRAFRERGQIRLELPGEATRRSLLSSTLRRRRKSPALPVKPEKPDSPIVIASDERLD